MNDSDHNIIQNNKFYDSAAFAGIRMDYSDYNQFINNIFLDAPNSGRPTTDAGGTLPADFINWYSGGNYNLFSGNTFGRCDHDALGMFAGNYNVFRGNTFQNQYHTGLNLDANTGPDLIENNYFYDQGADMANDPFPTTTRDLIQNSGIQDGGAISLIIRKNIFDNNGSGLKMGDSGDEISNNRVYNNTFNGGVRPLRGHSVDAYTLVGNVFKNNAITNSEDSTYPGDTYPDGYNFYYRDNNGAGNLFYNNNSYGSSGSGGYRYRATTDSTLTALISKFPAAFPSRNISVDPKYTNAVGRNFTLKSDSPMINAGTWLTIITSSTASGVSSFVVDEPGYFYDGWGIPGEKGDIIKTQNGEITTIMSINYDTHRITVSPAINVVKGEGLALNYSGSSPDIGAREYGETADIISPPNGLIIKINQN